MKAKKVISSPFDNPSLWGYQSLTEVSVNVNPEVTGYTHLEGDFQGFKNETGRSVTLQDGDVQLKNGEILLKVFAGNSSNHISKYAIVK